VAGSPINKGRGWTVELEAGYLLVRFTCFFLGLGVKGCGEMLNILRKNPVSLGVSVGVFGICDIGNISLLWCRNVSQQ
jgi:hypothetical protein